MDDRYLKQATLVVRCIPAITAEDCFAIKGGTAINLFELNLPRLSVGHNRPLHELLNPTLQDHEDIFNQQFAGMSDTPFSYQEHKDTFARLHEELLGSLTDDDKQHLLDFVSLQGQPEDFGIPHLAELPAIIWKRKNLETLRQANSVKFAEQRELLEAALT